MPNNIENDDKPEILITGAGGALAQKVISSLKKHHSVIVLDFRHKPQVGHNIASYKVDFNKRELEDIFKKHNIGTVIHLGRIGANQSTRLNRYNANVLGTQKLLDFCVKYKVTRTIVLSTYHVYGANPYNPSLIEEETPLKAADLTMDMVDSVELENLANIYLWKHPELNITILRPCNIVGPGINNTMSRLLASKYAPYLVGFSPMMQFIHVDDMAKAVCSALTKNKSGIFNVAPDDWVAYHAALAHCDCTKIPILSIPPVIPKVFSRISGWKSFPLHLVNYFKYPVIIDGTAFNDTFDFKPEVELQEIFAYYKIEKENRGLF